MKSISEHEKERGEALTGALLAWFRSEQRPLPWRETYAPYQVWISEVMLQQTQMERVVGYFTRWMERFPDVASVADADEEEVLKYWEGLGYYARARNLHACAKALIEKHGGRIPQEYEALRALPGLGPYTAGAIRSIAFNKPQAAVDANVKRVLARLFDWDKTLDSRESAEFFEGACAELTPPEHARDFTQALMEFGALVCGKRPKCEACPVREYCQAFDLGVVGDRPLPRKSKDVTLLNVVTGVLLHRGRIFIQKRLPEGAWGGLWEFPGGRIEPGEDSADALVREYEEETGFAVAPLEHIGELKHAYTTFRVTLQCYFAELEHGAGDNGDGGAPPKLTAATEYLWVRPAELERYAFPAGHRKLIRRLEHDPRFGRYLLET